MCENSNDFLASRSIADFIQLIKVDDRVHAFAFRQNLHDFAPGASLIGVRMAFQETAVAASTQRDERKLAPQNLADSPDLSVAFSMITASGGREASSAFSFG
jgi:hypothetical protein